MLGKVNLSPALGTAQFPDSLACRRADVPCHAFIIGLACALYLVHPLFGAKGIKMNRFLAFLSLAVCSVCLAQTPQIKSGATVYIEPMNGYESYLTAAFAKKQVPLIVVADESKAQYIIRSNVNQVAPTHPAVIVNNTNNVNNGDNSAFNRGFGSGFPRAGSGVGHTSASIAVIDSRSSQVLFAYSVEKDRQHQLQSDAEACAKHLKEFIEKPKK